MRVHVASMRLNTSTSIPNIATRLALTAALKKSVQADRCQCWLSLRCGVSWKGQQQGLRITTKHG